MHGSCLMRTVELPPQNEPHTAFGKSFAVCMYPPDGDALMYRTCTEYDRARTAAGLYGFLVPKLVHSPQAQVLSAGGPKARLRFLTPYPSRSFSSKRPGARRTRPRPWRSPLGSLVDPLGVPAPHADGYGRQRRPVRRRTLLSLFSVRPVLQGSKSWEVLQDHSESVNHAASLSDLHARASAPS